MSKNIIIKSAQEMPEGEGAKVKRSFPNQEVSNVDPFILMDEFFVEPPASFALHPHRGFEAITFMLEGAFEHEDTSGNSGIIKEKEAQLMNTGKGLQHSEKPGTEGMNHGLQLWINLPQKYKDSEPSYQKASASDLLVQEDDSKKIYEILGERSPLAPHVLAQYYFIEMQEDSQYSIDVPEGYQSFVYCVSGQAKLSGAEEIQAGQIAIIKNEGHIEIEANDKLEFAFAAGEPLNS